MKWLTTIRQTVTDVRKMTLGLMAGTAAVNSIPGTTPQAQAANNPDHPNIIFILADDLGWTDINCRPLAKDSNGNYIYESDPNNPNIYDPNATSTYAETYDSTFYRTPELSRLREQAMRFTNAHTACPKCKPTRVSIMTGKYPIRAGLPGNGFEAEDEMLSLAETTIAEALDNHGVDYNSAFMGKWHLSTKYAESVNLLVSESNPEKYDPQNQGFEVNIGGSWYPCPSNPEISGETNSSFWFNGIDFNDHDTFIPGYGLSPGLDKLHGNYVNHRTDYGYNNDDPNEYLTDRLNWEAVDFIKDAAKQDRPFFLYLSHYGPHVPTTAKQKMVDGYVAPVAHYRFDSDSELKDHQNCKDFLIYGKDSNQQDKSQNKYDGNFKGTTSIVDNGQFGDYLNLTGAGYFEIDGGNNTQLPGYDGDYSYKGVADTNSRTVSAWIKTSQKDGAIIAWGTESTTENSKWQLRVNGSGKLELDLGKDKVSTTETVNDDTWNHVAAVYDGSSVKLYLNGEEKKSEQYTIGTNIGEYVRIGDFSNSNHDYFTGCIDEVSIYDVALDEKEIARIADENTAPHVDGVYAAMIENIDEGIGEIRQALKEEGVDDNTIIIFFSDNGGYGATSNHPLRGYKGQQYEGGNRVPLLVYWPKVTTEKSPENLTCRVPVSSIDILPTIVQMGYPSIDPNEYYVLDGKSLTGILTGGQNSIERNNYSLIVCQKSDGFPEVSNQVVLGTGIGESKDISSEIDSYDYKYFNSKLYKIHQGEGNNKTLVKNAEYGDPITSGTVFEEMKARREAWEKSLKVYIEGKTGYYSDVQTAVNNASPLSVDTIVLPPRTFHENITINKNVILRSKNPNDPRIVAATIIDGSYQSSVITATSNCTIEGITVTNGKATNGGGINGGNHAVNLYKCRVIGNTAENAGGGIWGCDGTISNCVIEGNRSLSWGGGFGASDGNVLNCVIANNIATYGGGMHNSDAEIENCTIAYNYAKSRGGGLDWCDNNAVIRNCIIYGNEAPADKQLDTTCNTPSYCCIKGWLGGGTGNIDNEPYFVNAPLFVDITSADSLSSNEISVGDPNVYDCNDFIEYNKDGIRRRVMSIDEINGILVIEPNLIYPAEPNKLIQNWGHSPSDLKNNCHLMTNSPCIDRGSISSNSLDSQLHLQLNNSLDDDSENSRTAVFMGETEPVYVDGYFGKALVLDGTNYVEIVDYKGVTGTSSRTCSAWIKTINNPQCQILTWGNNSVGEKWMFRVEADGKLGLDVWQGYSTTTTATVNDGKWHHVAVVMEDDGSPDISEVVFYVDGILADSSASNTQAIATAEIENVSIGARIDDGVSYEFFPGQIDDVRIYQKALTKEEVNMLFDFDIDLEPRIIQRNIDMGADEFNPISGYWTLDNILQVEENEVVTDYDGTIHNNVMWSDGILENSLNLTGDDYVEITDYPGITGTSSRTCSAWIRTTSSGQILSWGSDAPGEKWVIRLEGSEAYGIGRLRAEVGTGRVIGTKTINDGQWHHIAVVLEDDGSPNISEAKLYIDGEEETLTTNVEYDVNTESQDDVRIGMSPYYTDYFEGQIDDVRIYSSVLSVTDVNDLYLLNDIATNPEAHWTFNQSFGGSVLDSSGNNHRGIYVDSDDTSIPSKITSETTLNLDGDDYIEIAEYQGISGSSPRTCVAWINIDSDYLDRSAILSWGESSSGKDWCFRTGSYGDDPSNSKLEVGVWNGVIRGSTLLNDASWHHVSAVYANEDENDDDEIDLKDILLYVDGIRETTTSYKYTGSPPTVNTGVNENVLIGAELLYNLTNPYYGYYFSGNLDDVQIYSKALSDLEIFDLARPTLAHWKFDESNGTTASDSSGNEYDGTLNNSPVWQPTDGQINGALEFDGTDDYVEVPYIFNPAQTSFSVFAWVRLDSKSPTSYQAILQQVDNTGPGRTLLLRTVDDKLQTSIGGSATVSTSAIFSEEGQWVHVGVTYDGQTVELYADGEEVGSFSKTAESCSGGLLIGRHKTDTATCWNGLIDDVRIYGRVLEVDEISVLALEER